MEPFQLPRLRPCQYLGAPCSAAVWDACPEFRYVLSVCGFFSHFVATCAWTQVTACWWLTFLNGWHSGKVQSPVHFLEQKHRSCNPWPSLAYIWLWDWYHIRSIITVGLARACWFRVASWGRTKLKLPRPSEYAIHPRTRWPCAEFGMERPALERTGKVERGSKRVEKQLYKTDWRLVVLKYTSNRSGRKLEGIHPWPMHHLHGHANPECLNSPYNMMWPGNVSPNNATGISY